MKNIPRLLTLLASVVFLSGCYMATHEAGSENKTSTIDLPVKMGVDTYICKGGKYRMVRGFVEPESVALPYGNRVSIKARYDHLITTAYADECKPEISFIPKKNFRYKLHLVLHNNTCRLVVFYYDSNSRIGLSRDKTIGLGDCRSKVITPVAAKS